MTKYKLIPMIGLMVVLGTMGSVQGNVLWDINDDDPVSNATTQAFVDAGVTENLGGSSVFNVQGNATAAMTDPSTGVTLSYLTGRAGNTHFGDKAVTFSNPLLVDYLYNGSGASQMDSDLQISGLSGVLESNTLYSFYLFGIGDDPAGTQNSTFTFNGSTITVPVAPIADGPLNRYAKFSFSTGATVQDTLTFTWHWISGNTGFNGFAIVAFDPTGLLPPTTLVATGGAMQVDLSWDPGQNAESYTVYRAEDDTGSNLVAIASNVVTTAYTDSVGLVVNTPYYYAVTSVSNGVESVFSAQASAIPFDGSDTTPPAIPSSLTAWLANSVAVVLEWDENTEPDLASYSVYRSTNSGGPFTNLLAVATTNHIDQAPSSEETYYYAVSATDFTGNESGLSPALAVDLGSRNIIEGEDWDFQSNDIHNQATSDIGGGENVGWISPGEYANYLVDLPAAGDYRIDMRVARSPDDDTSLDLSLEPNTSAVLGTVTVPNTGGWQEWETISANVNFPVAGPQTLRMSFAGGLNINWFELTLLAPASPAITDFGVLGQEFVLEWDAQAGAVYTVEQKLDMVDMVDWADVPGFVGMTGLVDGTMSVTGQADQTMVYFRVDEIPPPPIFFDDLESGAAGWTSNTVTGTTDWELGTPSYANTRGSFTTAYSGSNAWATGLTGPCAANDNALLRTPEIDLSGVPGAVLTFYQVTDLEPDYDFGYVNILTNGVVAETNLYAANSTSTNWTRQSINLNEYTNKQIVIEFELASDHVDFEQNWFGWAIDDISVKKGPPSPPPPPPFTNSVTRFILVDSSGTNNPPVDLTNIVDGATLDLDALGVANTNVNIRAEVDGAVGSVTFVLTGATANNRTESVGPYYQFGDTGGDPFDGTLNAGAHTIDATPWENGGGAGEAGTNLTVNFTVTFTP